MVIYKVREVPTPCMEGFEQFILLKLIFLLVLPISWFVYLNFDFINVLEECVFGYPTSSLC